MGNQSNGERKAVRMRNGEMKTKEREWIQVRGWIQVEIGIESTLSHLKET